MPIKKKKKTKVKKKVIKKVTKKTKVKKKLLVKLLKKVQKNLLLKLNLNGLKVVQQLKVNIKISILNRLKITMSFGEKKEKE